MIIGDFNRQVGDVIKGSCEKVSPGGRLKMDLISNNEYVLLNNLEIVSPRCLVFEFSSFQCKALIFVILNFIC